MQELKVENNQNVSLDCAVCGTKNPYSLGAKFYELEGGFVVGVLLGEEHHQSFPGRMHGGMISAIIDETIGRAVQIGHPEKWGVTGELKVRFLKPTPLHKKLYCFAKLFEENKWLFKGAAVLESESGELVATGEATYMKMEVDKITNSLDEKNWFKEDVELPKSVVFYNDEELNKLLNKKK